MTIKFDKKLIFENEKEWLDFCNIANKHLHWSNPLKINTHFGKLDFYDGDEEFEQALAKYDAPTSFTTPKHLRFTNKTLHSYDLLKIYTDPNDKVVAIERKGKSYYSNVVIKNRNTGRKVYEGEIFHKGYELHTF